MRGSPPVLRREPGHRLCHSCGSAAATTRALNPRPRAWAWLCRWRWRAGWAAGLSRPHIADRCDAAGGDSCGSSRESRCPPIPGFTTRPLCRYIHLPPTFALPGGHLSGPGYPGQQQRCTLTRGPPPGRARLATQICTGTPVRTGPPPRILGRECSGPIAPRRAPQPAGF